MNPANLHLFARCTELTYSYYGREQNQEARPSFIEVVVTVALLLTFLLEVLPLPTKAITRNTCNMASEQIDIDLQLLNPEVKALLAAFEKKTQRLEKKTQRLEQEIERLQKNEQMNENLVQKSIKNVYLVHDESWSCPKIKLHKTIRPSIEGHKLKGMGKQPASYDTREHRNGNEDIWDKINDRRFVVVSGTRDGKYLASNFDPLEKLDYMNEIDVQFHTALMVKDAIHCLNGREHIRGNMEVSHFGITPDILVITRGGKMVFVIEIKAPDREGTDDNVCENELVGGQIWLYLMTMKAAGIDNPLGAICTFNKIRIVSLKDMNSHPFDDATKMLRRGDITQWDIDLEKKVDGDLSPNPKLQKVCDKIKEYDLVDPIKLFPDHELEENQDGVLVFKSARLYGGKILENSLVFPALVLSLLTALIESNVIATAQVKEPLPEVSLGDRLGGRLFAWGTEDIITMGFTKRKLVVKEGKIRAKHFHLLDKLGRGNEAEVRLALTTSGLRCAIKFYHFRHSRSASEEERSQEDTAGLKKLEETRDREFVIWEKLYKGRSTRKVQLAGRPCLQMVYGKPLSENEREKCWDEIEQELLRFYKEGLWYKATDFRWRHVMKDHNEKLFLTDLSSLTYLPKEVLTCEVVQEEKGKLVIVEENWLGMSDKHDEYSPRRIKDQIESFRNHGFRSKSSQMESTSNGIEHGDAVTPRSGQNKKRLRRTLD